MPGTQPFIPLDPQTARASEFNVKYGEIMICPKCHAEYRAGFKRCADCNVYLVEKVGSRSPEKHELNYKNATTYINQFNIISTFKSFLKSRKFKKFTHGEKFNRIILVVYAATICILISNLYKQALANLSYTVFALDDKLFNYIFFIILFTIVMIQSIRKSPIATAILFLFAINKTHDIINLFYNNYNYLDKFILTGLIKFIIYSSLTITTFVLIISQKYFSSFRKNLFFLESNEKYIKLVWIVFFLFFYLLQLSYVHFSAREGNILFGCIVAITGFILFRHYAHSFILKAKQNGNLNFSLIFSAFLILSISVFFPLKSFHYFGIIPFLIQASWALIIVGKIIYNLRNLNKNQEPNDIM